jgi:small neutral amino acid transporter SnatA (MarC family)
MKKQGGACIVIALLGVVCLMELTGIAFGSLGFLGYLDKILTIILTDVSVAGGLLLLLIIISAVFHVKYRGKSQKKKLL